MDYSKMSDMELNILVRSALHGEPSSDFDRFFHSLPTPDYCNDPAAAWPIINSTELWNSLLECFPYDWPQDSDYSSRWDRAMTECETDNPLRAAMIVFLRKAAGEKPHNMVEGGW